MNEQRSSRRPSTSYLSPTETTPCSHSSPAPPVWLVLALTFVLGCAEDPSVCDSVEGEFCYQCNDGAVTCTYDGVSVTTEACDGCQTRLALFDELCAMGRTESRAEVDASMVCEPADTGAE